ncbi:MAG: phosphonate ABC transporter ATP-binding protein [Desulfobacteraceae bacterium]|nr:MAG: phosphonate ABC transporter ATP-binding protein [Desulfobacteraceae bacterium]
MNLTIETITKRFNGKAAVDQVHLDIPQGQLVGIIGRSGAGKSTLLRLINRLIEPTQGRVIFGASEITKLRGRRLLAWRARCGMIFQQFNLVKRLDVLTNVLIGRLSYHATLPSLFKQFSMRERAMAVQALERVEILDQALKRVDTLSGGQQQRVAIARALVQQPELILADEPIASLDLRSSAMVMDTLKKINQEDGITIIASLHNLATARNYCHRIIGMSNGRIVFDGSPAQLTAEAVCAVYGVEQAREELEEDPVYIPEKIALQPMMESAVSYS